MAYTFENVISYPITGRLIKKPRNEGLTMVIDTGLGVRYAQDLVEIAGEYIDFIKLGFGTSRLINIDIIKKKISIYRDYSIDVYPGGTLLEVAFIQGKLYEFLDEANNIGFTAIEVSDGTIPINDEQRVEIIEAAKERGFKVITEVGKKDATRDLTSAEYVKAIKRDLDLGVFKVIVEAREAGRGVGIYDEKGDVREDKLWTIVKDIDVRNLIFEAPNRNQQVYLILKFGPNVNLGNIHPNDVIPLEALRRGLRADTLKTLISIR
ncbi:MAG: phosphosulfolactate synthase [Thermosphaera sp.]